MQASLTDLNDILDLLNKEVPFSLAEPWDNVGLMLGDPAQSISALLVGLDPTEALLDEAIASKANCIVTHHPAIFHPITSLRTDQPLGRFITKALKNKIAVIGCHTNLDVIEHGVSAILAKKIGITNPQPLVVKSREQPKQGFGCIGSLAKPQTGPFFLESLCNALDLPALKFCGPLPESISQIAVCGGSGSDFAEMAFDQHADLYITGEVKHSTARWAEECGLCIVDAGHFATENIIVESFADRLTEIFAERQLSVPVYISKFQKNPFTYYFKSEKE